MRKIIVSILLVVALSVTAYAYDCSDEHAVCPMARFNDLSPDIWCHEGLDFVISRGYMQGKTETMFVSNGSMTRAMVVTVLYRIAADRGLPSDGAFYLPFSDVGRDAWFYDALCWAYKHDIAKGFTADKFAPNASVTREQITLFLSRFAAFSGESVTPRGNIGVFTDVAALSAESRSAISWAVGEGILYGYSDGSFRPKACATRAHFAVMLQRWLDENKCTDHIFGLKEVALEPTCTENGRYEQVCTVCGYKSIGVIPAVGHSYGEKHIGIAPTCISEGAYVKVCVNCGDVMTVEAIPVTGHSYVERTVKAASCTETGIKQRSCTVCGNTVSETIPKTAHKFVNGRCACGAYEKTARKITSPVSGDKVIIYNPACGCAIGTATFGDKLACVAVSVSGDSLGYTPNGGAAIMSIELDGSGFYLKSSDGKYLTSTSDGDTLFFGSDKSNALWVLDGGRIKNKSSSQYIECYADSFTCYGYSSRYADRYTMELYKLS